MKPVLLLLLIHLSLPQAFSQNRWYVNAAATGSNDGASWANAFTGLQDALAAAGAGDEIWVAQGVYYPTDASDRGISFQLTAGVKLFGGFAGGENSLDERDWTLYPTVLSGDIGVPGDSTDNSFNVVYMYAPDTNTVLDGCTIRDGAATFSGAAGSYDRKRCGGGLYIDGFDTDAYPDIVNCAFIRNSARTFGGGVMSYGGGDGSTAPRMINCRFENNKAATGGGMARIGGSWIERGSDLDGCLFINNNATFQGGGYYYADSERLDTLEIRNCDFVENVASSFGGGIYLASGRNNPSGITLTNNNFNANTASTHAAMYSGIDNLLELKFIFLQNVNLFRNNKSINSGTNSNTLQLLCYKSDETSIIKLKDCSAYENNTPIFTLLENRGTTQILNSNIYKTDSIDFLASLSDKTILIENSLFYSNNNKRSIFRLGGPVSDINFSNCVFFNNHSKSTTHLRHAEYLDSLLYTNCTFINNSIDTLLSPPSNGDQNVVFANSIIKNSYGFWSYFDTDDIVNFTHSYLDSFDCATQPSWITCGPGLIIGGDPMFVYPDSGDFRLHPCSPLVNAGNNTFATGLVDLDDLPRIQGGAVDMGAYETAAPSLSAPAVPQPACPGESNGSLMVDIAGGCMPFQIDWINSDSGGSGNGFLQLPAGNYQFTVTDQRGASLVFSAQVPVSDPISISASVTNASSPVASDGAITLLAISGGASPFDIQWSTGQTGLVCGPVPPGTYIVTVTDATDCTLVQPFTVSFISSVSSPENSNRWLRFSPNPANHRTRILSADPPRAFRVYSSHGKLLLHGSGHDIDIASLPQGACIVQAVFSDYSVIGVLIVE